MKNPLSEFKKEVLLNELLNRCCRAPNRTELGRIFHGFVLGIGNGRSAIMFLNNAALEALREKPQNERDNMDCDKCENDNPICLTCSRLKANGGTCEPNTNSFVQACKGYCRIDKVHPLSLEPFRIRWASGGTWLEWKKTLCRLRYESIRWAWEQWVNNNFREMDRDLADVGHEDWII